MKTTPNYLYPLLILMLLLGLVFLWMNSATNTETTEPEATKAKATAGVQLWEFHSVGGVESSPAIGTGAEVRSSPAIESDGTV